MAKFTKIKDAKEDVMKKLTKVARGAGIQVFNNCILGSPVKSGRFRGNWQVSVGNMITSEIPEEQAINTIVEASVGMSKWSLNEIAFLTNNVPYAERIEQGWSGQAPAGWVRQNIDNGQKALDDYVKKVENGNE